MKSYNQFLTFYSWFIYFFSCSYDCRPFLKMFLSPMLLLPFSLNYALMLEENSYAFILQLLMTEAQWFNITCLLKIETENKCFFFLYQLVFGLLCARFLMAKCLTFRIPSSSYSLDICSLVHFICLGTTVVS